MGGIGKLKYQPGSVPGSGCTDPTAYNYEPLVSVDDGSCTYIIYGCVEDTATNYSASANTDDGSCVWNGCWDITTYNVGNVAYQVYFNAIALPIEAQGYSGATGYIQNNTCINTILGCTDPLAFNYNTSANIDDGSCIAVVNGCTSSTASNFNTSANTDDGSCAWSYCTVNELDTNYPDLITLQETSNYSNGNNIITNNCVSGGCTEPQANNYDSSATWDDGSCDDIPGCTDPTALNYNSVANVDDGSCVAIIYGCTDPTMFNYSPDANVDDGSCVPIVLGCTNGSACNFDPLANALDTSACVFANPNADCDGNCLAGFVDVGSGCVAVVNGCTDLSACNHAPGANVDDGSCVLPNGCTDVIACNYDASATCDDGTCTYTAANADCNGDCNPGYSLDSNGACVLTVDGCTDVDACNYNIYANNNDGSCTYADPNANCSGACLSGFVDNGSGSCVACVYGCMSANDPNYDSSATCHGVNACQDCTVAGCTDPTATNYNPFVTCEDGSCIYSPDFGCTELNASNYSTNAQFNQWDGCNVGCHHDSTNSSCNASVSCVDGYCNWNLSWSLPCSSYKLQIRPIYYSQNGNRQLGDWITLTGTNYTANTFVLQGLTGGEYDWRVKCVGTAWVPGEFTTFIIDSALAPNLTP